MVQVEVVHLIMVVHKYRDSTEEGAEKAGGGTTQDWGYVSATNEGGCGTSSTAGEDGYVLITGSGTVSTTIVSNAFTAGSAFKYKSYCSISRKRRYYFKY